MTTTPKTSWSLIQKVGFRFFFIYFLYVVCFNNNSTYPLWYVIFDYPLKWSQRLIPWLAEHVYGITGVTYLENTGSGDTSFDYASILTGAILGVIGSFIWSLVDRKRSSYNTLYYWLTVALRYYIGIMLINYGLSKVIQLQFSPPGPYRLLNTFGESSPMGLAWAFLGFSEGYNMFMGIAEIMAGLLLFRRTMTFGLIVTLMTALNVMAVNYFYDVPVKIVSTHLVIMTLFLLSRDIKALLLFFFTKTEAKLRLIKRPAYKKKINLGLDVLKVLVIGYALIFALITRVNMAQIYGVDAEKPLLYGAYKVTDVLINGDTLTNYKDKRLWFSVCFQWPGSLRIQRYAAQKNTFYGFEKDSLSNQLELTSWSNPNEYINLTYKEVDSVHVNFDYTLDKDSIRVYTKKYSKDDFTLTERGFNWISEYPYNQ